MGTGPLTDAGLPALPDRLQVVPVHTVPTADDGLLRAFSGQTCPEFDVERAAVMQSEAVQELEHSFKHFFKIAENITGITPVTLNNVRLNGVSPLKSSSVNTGLDGTRPSGVSSGTFHTMAGRSG